MRIGWATPWNEQSAIADSAGNVALELVERGHAVTILRTEVGSALAFPPRPTSLPVFSLSDLSDEELTRDFDVLVGHLGNYHAYHGALLPRLGGLEVVGIFHDAFYAHLMVDWAEQHGGEAALRQIVHETYGQDALRPDEPFWTELGQMARRRPMLEWLARQTIAAVAHSGHYITRLRTACTGPVVTIPLAFTAPNLPPPPPAGSRMTIAAIGHANANKRIDQVLLTMGASPILRGRCRLRVIGEATPAERERLTALAVAAGASPPEFTGWVSDADLRSQLRDVDVISCLRNPVLEGASASLVVALASGRPTLVTNHGCYADVPPDTVMACRPESEALDAMRHLEHLVADPAWGVSMGKRGRALAGERHSPAAYAKALLPFLEEIVATRPRRNVRRQLLASSSGALSGARQQLFGTLFELGLRPDDPALARIDTILDEMGALPARKERATQEERTT
nr:glycosyltransferase [Roseomonas sp. SXEYE001]